MTTDTNPLQERIARALMAHECDQHEDQDECMTCDSSMVTCSHPPFMYCDEHDTAVGVGESCPVALEHAAAVLPIIAAEVQAAKAEAWDDCAHEADRRWLIGGQSAAILHDRNPYREQEAGHDDER